MSSELIAGPDLDRRVCEALNIPPTGRESRMEPLPPILKHGYCFDPAEVKFELVDVFPAVSTDPAQIPVLMEGIAAKFNTAPCVVGPLNAMQSGVVGDVMRSAGVKHSVFSAGVKDGEVYGEMDTATPNLALCGLALKLGAK